MTMRKLPKLLEVLSLLALALSFWITVRTVAGPNHLPDKIPTHFDIHGNPDAFGTASMLFLLPGIALALYLLMTAVSRNPAVFNYPVRVTRENQSRLQELALNMIALLKAETITLLALIQYQTIQTVRQTATFLPKSLMPMGIAAIFLTVAAFVTAMRRTRSR